MRRVFNFSGGRSSAMATLVSDPQPEDIILFTDTGREHPLTYNFISDFEKYEGLKVHTAAFQSKKAPGVSGFDALIAHKSYLSNKTQRICTENLKVVTARRYLRTLGLTPYTPFIQIIGFRADEKRRIDGFRNTWHKTITHFPLNELGINKAMVLKYWTEKPYNLEIPPILGKCDLCFLKGKNAIIKILQQYPELAEKWIRDEEMTKAKRGGEKSQYFSDVTYRQLLNAAKSQKTLFENVELENLTPAYSCACTNF